MRPRKASVGLSWANREAPAREGTPGAKAGRSASGESL
jgi:hypothetical protein